VRLKKLKKQLKRQEKLDAVLEKLQNAQDAEQKELLNVQDAEDAVL